MTDVEATSNKQSKSASEEYDIIEDSGNQFNRDKSSTKVNMNGTQKDGKFDFGAQLKKTPQHTGRPMSKEGNPDYLGHLKKVEGGVAVRPSYAKGTSAVNGEERPRLTSDELMKMATAALKDVDDKDKRDMAARRGMSTQKVNSAGMTFEGFKPNSDDTGKLDFKSVLRKSIRRESGKTAAKSDSTKPEWTQQKRVIRVSEIENKSAKPKGTEDAPDWLQKANKNSTRQRVTELEHKKNNGVQQAPPHAAPEWADKVPSSRGILVKTELRSKSRSDKDNKPDYRGVLKSSN